MKILIIEDEIKSAKELERILLSFGDYDIEIAGKLDSVEDSIYYLSHNRHPDLIFSDIQLVDGMCFDIYHKIEVKSPIVFCTAFNEYMVEAFDTNAISYILKPISSQKIETALQKYMQMKEAFEPSKAAKAINTVAQQLKYQYKTVLLVDQGEKIIPLQVKEIAFIYLDKNILKITTLNNQRYFISSSLDELERTLDPEIFYRANRQFLINRNAVAMIERYFARKLVIKASVETPETIIISKAKASDFLKWLEGRDQLLSR